MKAIIDSHTHTIASGHNTTDKIIDLIRSASERGLKALGITDHNPAIPGSAKDSYFRSLSFLPRKRLGVKILYGSEVDVMDESGKLGMKNSTLALMDVVIVSEHPPCLKPSKDKERNTNALVNAVKSGLVDIVGHPDDEKYPLDRKRLVLACKEEKVLIEINNSSLIPNGYRGNAKPFDLELLSLCKEYSVPVILNSDSHGKEGVGIFDNCEKVIKEASFPSELIANYNEELYFSVIQKHKKLRETLKD